jgi:hypothetical protein
MDINLFSPLPLKATQVMSVTATTSVIALTSVGSHYQANLEVYNQGGDIVFINFGASATTSASVTGGYIIGAGRTAHLVRPPGPTWISAICSGALTSELYVSTGYGASFSA